MNAVYLSPETVDPWNPKVVRAGMGAHFRVPLIPLTLEPSRSCGDACRAAWLLVPPAVPTMQLTGRERRHWSSVARRRGSAPKEAWGTEEVGIPLAHGVESLNAAVAGAVILEAARQRRLARAEDPI